MWFVLGFLRSAQSKALDITKEKTDSFRFATFLQEQQNVQHMGDSADPFVVMEVLLLLENQEWYIWSFKIDRRGGPRLEIVCVLEWCQSEAPKVEHCNFELQLSENCKARLFGKSLLLLVCLLPRPITNLVGTCTHIITLIMSCYGLWKKFPNNRER